MPPFSLFCTLTCFFRGRGQLTLISAPTGGGASGAVAGGSGRRFHLLQLGIILGQDRIQRAFPRLPRRRIGEAGHHHPDARILEQHIAEGSQSAGGRRRSAPASSRMPDRLLHDIVALPCQDRGRRATAIGRRSFPPYACVWSFRGSFL